MKIALVGPTYPFRGGISHYTTLLYNHLQKKHQVQFYAFSRPYPRFLYPGDSSSDSSRMQLSNTRAISIIDWANPFTWLKTGLLITKWSPDVVIFPWWMWGWAIPFWIIGKVISLRVNAKILFMCHNVIEHETAFWKSALSKFALSIGDTFIVHSREDHDNLKKIFPGAKTTISVHPTYEIFRHVTVPKDKAREILKVESKFKEIILFFGIIRPYKGLRYLIEAMPQILSETPDMCLIIAGEFWEDKESYHEQIKYLHLEDNIRVLDEYIPNEDVGIYFSAADLVVLPYVSGTGSGIVQIAFGFNKPVIATRVGCLPQVVKHGLTGYLVEPSSASSIADAVLAFYREGREVFFRKNIKQEKSRFSWDRMVETIERI